MNKGTNELEEMCSKALEDLMSCELEVVLAGPKRKLSSSYRMIHTQGPDDGDGHRFQLGYHQMQMFLREPLLGHVCCP